MTKLILENYYSTSLVNEVDDSTLGEIEYQLAIAPQSDFGYLILDYETNNKEEIFYHRKAGNSVFQYGINRTNPKPHDFEASVQLNDSANIFNYITNLLPDHFFMYKTGENTMFIKGGKIYDDGEYKIIPNKLDINLEIGTNYLYIENAEIKSTTDTVEDKYIFGDVIVNGAGNISAFNNYNTIALVTSRTNKILRGASAPNSLVGIDGDYYINDTAKKMYGPKTNGAWDSGFSIQGADGLIGPGATVQVGNVSMGAPLSIPIITNVGTENNAIFDFVIPSGVDGQPGSMIEPTPGVPSTITDNAVPPAGTVVTHNTDEGWIKVTYENGVYTEYKLGGITTRSIDSIYMTETKSPNGVFEETGIQYDDGLFVNKTTGVTSFNGQVMYKNQTNIVEGTNKFNGTVIFSGQTTFLYYVNGIGVLEFNATHGSKQGFSYNDGGNKELTFVNLLDGTTLTFSINVTIAPITLSIGDVTRALDAHAYEKYCISGDTFPLTLGLGVHMFVAEVYSVGFHLSYIGQSVAIA